MSYEHELLEIMNAEGMRSHTPSIQFAEVINSYPKTRLKYNDFEIETVQIRYTSWAYALANGLKTSVNDGHSHFVDLGGIKAGDVVIINCDDSTVTILDKVVR